MFLSERNLTKHELIRNTSFEGTVLGKSDWSCFEKQMGKLFL